MRFIQLTIFACLALLQAPLTVFAGGAEAPLSGAETPRIEAQLGEDGIYHQTWFVQSFLDLKEDFKDAQTRGKRFAVIFEQRGCIYCTKMHKEVLSQKYVNDYVRENFDILSIDIWGSKDVTDFDGTKLTEKKLAERWGVAFTPTVVFFKDDLSGLDGKWGRPLEAVERLPLAFGTATFLDMFSFVRTGAYVRDGNFQRYHIERMDMRQKLKK